MKKIMNKKIIICFSLFIVLLGLFFVGGLKISNRKISGFEGVTFEGVKFEGAKFEGIEGRVTNLFTREDLKRTKEILKIRGFYCKKPLWFLRLPWIFRFSEERCEPDFPCDINNYFDEYRDKTGFTDFKWESVSRLKRESSVFRCDLSNADMRERDLSGAVLNFSFLYKADVSDANLSNIKAGGSNFTEADCTNTNFTRAKLPDAIFNNADCTNADFTDADLFSVDFRGANLQGANFTNANLFMVLFKGWRLSDPKDADLRGADFTGAKVRPYQVEFLESKGISGFVVVKAPLSKLGF